MSVNYRQLQIVIENAMRNVQRRVLQLIKVLKTILHNSYCRCQCEKLERAKEEVWESKSRRVKGKEARAVSEKEVSSAFPFACAFVLGKREETAAILEKEDSLAFYAIAYVSIIV